jgi:putative transposase
MYIDIKTLSKAIGKTPRAIQIRLKKDSSIISRPKDGRSLELLISTLPADWQTALAKAGKLPAQGTALAVLAPAAQVAAQVSAPTAVSAIGSKLDESQRRRLLIANKIKQRPAGIKRTKWIDAVADMYRVSPATVRRIAAEADAYGIVGKPRHNGRYSAWDEAAIDYLKGFWLAAKRQANGDYPKEAAWQQVQTKAKEMGWRIGSRSSAYTILNEVHPLLTEFAVGGNRALDNYFYIARDLDTLHPFQMVVGDQHIFDYWIADYETGLIRRPECYLWIDMHTRLIYGIAFAERSYNTDTVKQALRMGLYRWGRFDATYNDNGSSECSKAAREMVDDLLRYGMEQKDISDMFRAPDGRYIVEDENDTIVDVLPTATAWRRRIYAKVKNAKTKPIERFFRSFEKRLDSRLLPGKCATPGAAAAVDEVEQARLQHQKDKHLLLTMDQFVQVVLEELQAYEQEKHSTLKMSPMQKLEAAVSNGFDLESRQFGSAYEIELLVADRRPCTVQRGRVFVNGIWYQGDQLSATSGVLDDKGLYRFGGKRVEIRYNRHDPDFCYAIVNGEARRLHRVKKTEMLSQGAMIEALKDKQLLMSAVREAYYALVKPIGNVLYQPPKQETIKQAERINEAPLLPEDRRVSKLIPHLPLHPTKRRRYQWCLDVLAAGAPLSDADQDFLHAYQMTDEYEEYSDYWHIYEMKAQGGNRR